MIILDDFIEALNDKLKVLFGIIQPMTYGVAEPVLTRSGDDNEVVIPAIVDSTGECVNVFEEADENSMVMYHRLNSKSYSSQAPAYGSRKISTAEYDMSIIVFGQRKCTNPNIAEEKIVDLMSMMPAIDVRDSNFNGVQVLSSEFSGMPYFLTPDFYLFKINYRINSALNGCIKK